MHLIEEVLEVFETEDDGWWYVHSLHTGKEGYVPMIYLMPIEGRNAQM